MEGGATRRTAAPPRRGPRHVARRSGFDGDAGRVHLATLALAGAFLVWVNRGQWFQSDEFDFLANRGVLGDPALGLFAPHNEHWSTLPILVWRALFSVFGLTTYTPYVLLLVALHLVLAHLLWRTARDGGASSGAATTVVAGFLVLGAGFENLLWAFQSTFIASLVLGVVHVRLVTAGDGDRPGRRDALGVLAGVAALTCSGVGVTMVAVAALAGLLRCGWRVAAVAAGPPAGVYLLWLVLAGRRGLADTAVEAATIVQLPLYAGRGVVAATTGLLGPAVAGVVAALALVVAAVVWVRTDRVRSAAAVALASGPVGFFALVGLGRLDDSPDPASSRYVYVAIALLVPALARAASELVAAVPAPARAALWGVLAVSLVVPGALRLVAEAERYAEIEQAWRRRILAAAELVATEPEVMVAVAVTTDLEVDELARMDAEGRLPPGDPGALARAEARLLLGVGVVEDGGPAGAAPALVGVGRARVEEGGPGCVTVVPEDTAPQVALTVTEPTTVTVTPPLAPPARAAVEVLRRDPASGLEAARPIGLVLDRGEAARVGIGLSGDLVLTLPPDGPSQVCGLASS